MASRYRYNKRSGALQEAAPASPLQAQSAASARVPQTQVNPHTGRLEAPQAGGGVGDGRDPHTARSRSGLWFYTVEEGQQVLAIDATGKMEVIVGPRRVLRWGRRFREMEHYVAHPGEFLIVRYRDGRQEHLPGPAHCWLDSREHLSVEKEEVVQISAEEAVVVYAEEDGTVSRRVAHGPATFIPAPGEWLHTFSWHGSIGGQKVPNGLVFQKLWLLPDQMYHDVSEVRTADDAVLTVRLMIFFRLVDIEQLLASSHDPIGDFVNAATSDVVEFVRKHTFDSFKQNSDQLNALSTYTQLTARAEQCGYQIDNVVYRGYGAPPALQQMHEKATESRTRLQLERATEQQAQELEDLKQARAMSRASRNREEERTSLEHRVAIRQLELAEELRTDAARRDAERTQAWQDAEQARTLAAADDARQQAHLERLAAMGVDLTALLTAGRADQVIELRGGQSSHIHLDGRPLDE